jgi:hypothetical protein
MVSFSTDDRWTLSRLLEDPKIKLSETTKSKKNGLVTAHPPQGSRTQRKLIQQ